MFSPVDHVVGDIPELVEKAKKQYPNIDIVVTDYAGKRPLMAKIVEELVRRGSS